MDLRIIAMLAAAVAAAIAGGYWLVSHSQPDPTAVPTVQVSDPHPSTTSSMSMGGSGSNPGDMGMGMEMMGSTGGMEMGPHMQMMQQMMGQMQAQMAQMQQMMQACQQMMASMGAGMTGMNQAPQAGAAPPTEAELTRTSSEAGITVAVTFLNPLLPPEETEGRIIFRVALDTHAGDLLQYDLTQLAVLRTGEGAVVEEGFVWEPEGESGHHRRGRLIVPATVNGQPLITPQTSFLELEIREIGVPKRLFRWEAPLFAGPGEGG